MKQNVYYRAEIDLGFIAYVFEPGQQLVIKMTGNVISRFNVNTNLLCVLYETVHCCY